jgi:hypothetical protein
MRIIFWLRLGIGTIEEKSYNLLKHFPAHIYGAVDAISRLDPIHFTHGDVPRHCLAAVAELDVEQVAAQDDGHAMKGIAMPRRRLSRREPLPPNQIVSAMMQDLLICRSFHVRFPICGLDLP